jgi:SAM-dependent methyltransferase
VSPHYGIGVTDYWNHNVHYQRLVLDAAGGRCDEALDVGCGEGLLVRRLAGRARRVTGIDRSAEMIERARERRANGNTIFIEADFLRHPLPEAAYDLVCSVTVVHHMDFEAAVTKMARLVRPGGTLVIVGLARNGTPLDWVISAAGVPATRILARRHGKSDPPGVPIAEPEMSWGQVRRQALRLLPGATYRRRLLWRYSIVWQRPTLEHPFE